MALSREQQIVYEWLNDNLNFPVFADAYKGSIELLSSKQDGYVSFASHTGRDLMNILASEVAGIRSESSRVNYVEHVNGLQEDWKDEWRLGKDSLSEEPEKGHLIPFGLCQRISNLIEDHKAGQKRDDDKAALFFSEFLEYSDRDKVPINFLSEWKAAKSWFAGHAHLRSKPFRANTDSELEKHFNCLDGYLYIAASSQYERLRDLNEILDATNH